MVRPAAPTGSGSWGFFMSFLMTRVAVFIDGFNLYHALLKFRDNRVKWLDLRALSEALITPRSEAITAIYYFSAIAHWLPEPASRHEQYIAALRARGIQIVLGHFKNKDRNCNSCGARWIGHEEKETDVNIALFLLNSAYKDEYDKALLITRDSDLVPAVAMVRNEFPAKNITAVAPPLMGHSNDLIRVATAKRKITPAQVWRSLLPAVVYDAFGNPVAYRPERYS